MTLPREMWRRDLAFDTDDPEFCRGFEAARIYHDCERLVDSAGDALYATVHASNAEMMLRIAERFDLHVQSREVGDGWIEVTFR
jgi:hypothetical protein